ncbi:MAG: hypothetical protein JWO25_1798 [Alphaproteobacteria bacterium]|nr:hypothetical protein [Alphaproteobacteria bacterium]MDB5720753.1 hypothetical protein [Alphaproteobacteria bacterium]
MPQWAYETLVMVALGLATNGALTLLILNPIVALKQPPTRRAAYNAGIAYLICATIVTFSDLEDGPLPVVFLYFFPSAVLVFLYWRWVFGRGWIEDPAQLADGDVLEDDDWRHGAAKVASRAAREIGKR